MTRKNTRSLIRLQLREDAFRPKSINEGDLKDREKGKDVDQACSYIQEKAGLDDENIFNFGKYFKKKYME